MAFSFTFTEDNVTQTIRTNTLQEYLEAKHVLYDKTFLKSGLIPSRDELNEFYAKSSLKHWSDEIENEYVRLSLEWLEANTPAKS